MKAVRSGRRLVALGACLQVQEARLGKHGCWSDLQLCVLPVHLPGLPQCPAQLYWGQRWEQA